MSYANLQNQSDSEFKRWCGIGRNTFAQMVKVLRLHVNREGRRGGQNKLRTEDRLVITLEYWRVLPQPVSYRYKLGIARNYRRTNHDFKLLKRSRLPLMPSQLC